MRLRTFFAVSIRRVKYINPNELDMNFRTKQNRNQVQPMNPFS